MGMEITKLKVCTKQMNQDNDWIRTLFKKPPPFSFVLSRVSLPLIHPKTAGNGILDIQKVCSCTCILSYPTIQPK